MKKACPGLALSNPGKLKKAGRNSRCLFKFQHFWFERPIYKVRKSKFITLFKQYKMPNPLTVDAHSASL